MKLIIGEVINRLRKEKGVTQEDLANAVGVSIPAVSKWETGAAYPDITLLPGIARYFQTTIDEIMNYEMNLSKEEVMAINEVCRKLFEEVSFDEGMARCEGYLRQHPNHYFLKFRIGSLYMMHLNQVSTEKKMRDLLKRTISLFEDATKSSDLEIQNSAYYVLSSLYMMNQQNEKAIEVLKKMPRADLNPDMLLAAIYQNQGKEDEAKKLNQQVLATSLNQIISILGSMAYTKLRQKDHQGAIDILNKQKEMIEVLDIEALYMLGNSMTFMEVYAREKNVEKTIKYFSTYKYYLEQLEDMPKSAKLNPLLDLLDYDNQAISAHTVKYNSVQSIEMNTELDFVREDVRFIAIMEALKEL